MALCNIRIDLHGGRKCRKIAWSNRGHHIPAGHVGKERKQSGSLQLDPQSPKGTRCVRDCESIIQIKQKR
jgi:hypothetical protein